MTFEARRCPRAAFVRGGRQTRRAWSLCSLLLLLLLLSTASSLVSAQRGAPQPGTAASVIRLQHDIRVSIAREDSVLAQFDARLAQLTATAQSAARDTARAGVLTIASTEAFAASARAAVTSAAAVLAVRWGEPRLRRAFGTRVIRIVPVAEQFLGRTRPVAYISLVRNGRGEREQRLFEWTDDTTKAIQLYIEHNASEIVGEQLGSRLSEWLAGVRLSTRVAQPEAAFIDLGTAPALVDRRCAQGDIERCSEALGLVPNADPRSEWYTPEDRRVVARSIWRGRHRNQGDSVTATNPCLPQPASAACLAFIDSLAPSVWRRALSVEARSVLLLLAVESGGEASWGRLVNDTAAPPAALLASAANLPLSELVSRWRSRVMAARPDAVRPRGTVLLGSAGVMLLCLGVVMARRELA